MLDPDNKYYVFRCDRLNRTGGGVCALVSNLIKCHQISFSDECNKFLQASDCQIVCFDLCFKLTKYRMILVYRPPNVTSPRSQKQFQIAALTSILSILSNCGYTTLIFGDFNMPDIDWKTNFATRPYDVDSVFLKCMSELGMTQFVTNPTGYLTQLLRTFLTSFSLDDPYSIQVQDHSPL